MNGICCGKGVSTTLEFPLNICYLLAEIKLSSQTVFHPVYSLMQSSLCDSVSSFPGKSDFRAGCAV